MRAPLRSESVVGHGFLLVSVLLAGLDAACGARAAGPVATAMSKPSDSSEDLCFGGSAQVVLEDAYRDFGPGLGPSRPLFVGHGALLWGNGGTSTARLDLATLKPSGSAEIEMKASDGREVFGADRTGLFAVDLGTGTRRRLMTIPANEPGDEILNSEMELDDTYVYFNRGPNPFRAPQDSGLFRLRRDGRGQAELLASEPEGRRFRGFVVDEGFVYWTHRSDKERSAIFRRALQPGSAPQFVAYAHSDPLAIANGQVYYVDEDAIWSAPVHGGVPTKRVAIGSGDANSVVVDRGCLYWTNHQAIMRLGLAGKIPVTPEAIADELTFRGGAIATDGQYLYWLDWRRNRIWRAGRDAHARPPLPTLLAKPAVFSGPQRPAAAGRIDMGADWACASPAVAGEMRPQCWEASTTPTGKLVPWLKNVELATGPDRVCTANTKGGQCWPWPDFARARPEEWPGRDYHLWGGSVWLGGSFSCARAGVRVEKWTWSCSGDNSFGQLAGPGDKTQAGVGFPGRIALGTWHGCAIQDRDSTLCWGRGDGGQLGFAASDRCPIDGRAIPCSRKNAKVPFKLPPESQLFAGDMFTCALSKQGLFCWGASRDGWFGSAGACPARLRKEWPTLAGPTVPAPRATCARQPVLVPGFERVDIDPRHMAALSVGPRGACAVVNGRVRCVGAIFTPAAELRNAWVSPGARANACGVLAEGQVLCWGEGYSPAKAPQAPVPVRLVPDLSPDVAVVDFAPASGTAWPPGYRIHRECDRPMVALPRCPVDTTGEPWSSLIGQAPNLIGKIVSVRDRLIVGPPDNFGLPGGCTSRNGNPHGDEDLDARWTYAKKRPPYASLGCYPEQRFLVLGEGAEPLSLPDYACIGDESRLCCEAPAYGQTVVVTGELGRRRGWILTRPIICEVSGEK